jgi:hypothetical protein
MAHRGHALGWVCPAPASRACPRSPAAMVVARVRWEPAGSTPPPVLLIQPNLRSRCSASGVSSWDPSPQNQVSQPHNGNDLEQLCIQNQCITPSQPKWANVNTDAQYWISFWGCYLTYLVREHIGRSNSARILKGDVGSDVRP